MADYIYIPDSLGENAADYGQKPAATSYSVTLANDSVYQVNRVNKSLPEDIETTMFGFPIEDKRQILFADTHQYGIDKNDWDIVLGLVSGGGIKKTLLQNAPLTSDYQGIWLDNSPSQSIMLDLYAGIVTYAKYENSAIELTIDTQYDNDPNNPSDPPRNAACSTKQVFDCDVAANTFASFGIVRESVSDNCISQCGLFSSTSGWYIEIQGNGLGNNFRVVRRYTDSSNIVTNIVYNRSSFVDKLDGTGTSGHTINFSRVVMLGIEIGSYDGSAVKFYAYVPDARAGGSTTWVMFHKINISDTLDFPERNASALPVTFIHRTKITSGYSKLKKYGTSVTKIGSTNSVVKMFSAAGQFQNLTPAKEIFLFGMLTKELFNSRFNYTKHYPKYLNAISNVPTEIVARRFRVTPANSATINLNPSVQEQYDPNNLVYLVEPSSKDVLIVSTTLQTVVRRIDRNARNIAYFTKNDVLYVAEDNSSTILILNGVTGDVITSFIPNVPNSIDLTIISITSPAQDRLIITNSTGFTVWNITNWLEPVLLYSVSGLIIPPNASVLAADNRFFVLTSTSILVYSATTSAVSLLQTISQQFEDPLAITYSQLKLFATFAGVVRAYTRFGTATTYTLDNQFTFNISLANPDIITSVDAVDVVYVASSTTAGVVRRRNYDGLNSVTTINTAFPTIGISVDADLKTILYNTSPILMELNSQTTFIDLLAPGAFLKGNLLAAGITALIQNDGYNPIGDIIASMIIGNGGKQLKIADLFQDYREFFTTTYDTFNNSLSSQDLVLFYMKHLGELPSKINEQIEWLSGFGSMTVIANVTEQNPLHVVNIGSGTISIITGQI